jgi:hypothetical protein
MAHEIGHNFGANHDAGRKCGDGFLMAPFAPASEDATSRKFSACSRKEITAKLEDIRSGRSRDRCYDHNFLRFSAKKLAFFLNTNVMINFFKILLCVQSKNADFFAKFFGENI